MFHLKLVTIATLLFATRSHSHGHDNHSHGPETEKLPPIFEYTLIASANTKTLTFRVN